MLFEKRHSPTHLLGADFNSSSVYGVQFMHWNKEILL